MVEQCCHVCNYLSRAVYLALQVIDHYEKPRNVGSFSKLDNSVGTGLVGAPACGDVMKLQIRVKQHSRRHLAPPQPILMGAIVPLFHDNCCSFAQVDEHGNITESCFKTFGCGSAIASSSVATEW